MKQYKVAILGATGAVGREMMKILAERDFPVAELHLLASERSVGQLLPWKGQDIAVELACDEAFKGMDIVLGAAENDIAKRFAPAIVKAGAVFVDNSSAFRMDPDVPLVIPEINPEDARKHKGIIANPNCTTIVSLVAINALNQDSPIESIIASSYQAVSGAGAGGPIELLNEVERLGQGEPVEPKVFQYQIAYNVIPQIGGEAFEGYTSEEMKMQNEGRKIMHLPELKVSCTCVRVPVVRSHSVSIVVRTREKISVERARQLIAAAPGCRLVDDLANKQLSHAAGDQRSGSGVRGPHPRRPHQRQRSEHLVLRRSGAQGRGHQRRADRPAAGAGVREYRTSKVKPPSGGSASRKVRMGFPACCLQNRKIRAIADFAILVAAAGDETRKGTLTVPFHTILPSETSGRMHIWGDSFTFSAKPDIMAENDPTEEQPMRNWRRAAALLLALCMTVLLAACGEDPNDEEKLSVVMTGTVRTMDPAQAVTPAERTVVKHVFENLMRPSAEGAVHAVARSYTEETALDGTVTYTFQLRTDAKWSDGSAVTAGDFVYAWRRLVDPETNSPNADALAMVAGTTRRCWAIPRRCRCRHRMTTRWWWCSAAATRRSSRAPARRQSPCRCRRRR